MPSYTIRVELRGNPTFQEYERLHSVMARLGYAKTISGIDSHGRDKTIDLPTGTYFGNSFQTVMQVRDQVGEAVRLAVQPNILFLVAETSNWATG